MITIKQTGKIFSLAAFLFFSVLPLIAADRFSVASGNWNSTATWSASAGGPAGASVPAAGDNVYIESNHTITVTANAACDNITFTSTGSSLLVNSSISLAVSGSVNLDISETNNVSCTISGAGTLYCASVNVGPLNYNPSQNGGRSHSLTSTLASFNAGSITVNSHRSGGRRRTGTFNLPEGTLTVSGSIISNSDNGIKSTFSMESGAETATLILTGTSPFIFPAPDNLLLNGSSSTVDYNRIGNQDVYDAIYNNITLSGSGAKTITGLSVNGILSMEGIAVATGTSPAYGNDATLQYKGSAAQTTGTELVSSLNNLTINNASGVTLSSDVTVNNVLTMISGNINPGASILALGHTPGSLNHISGTITGGFQREISSTGTEYLFPVGTETTGNALKVTFASLTPGPLIVQFSPGDIGNAGLPLNDGGTGLFTHDTTGYWTLTAAGTMESPDYDVSLNYSGFTAFDDLARTLKRTDGGNLTADGIHGTVTAQEISRKGMNGISKGTTDLAIATTNPLITTQPSDFTGCSATFTVAAEGNEPLTYQWQENDGTGFSDISNGGIYSGALSETLLISGAAGSMDGWQYRCVVSGSLGYSTTSTAASLTVNIPEVSLGYNYSMDITLDQASAADDLTDFPALVSITRTELITVSNGGHVENPGAYDIIFTDTDGNKLDHEIESYDGLSGEFIAWVRIPVLSASAATTIKMLYGNPSVSTDPSLTSVWTSNYKGVWHLNGSDYSDATVYSNDGTSNNTSAIAGKIAGARDFNGSSSYISVLTNGFVANDNNQTISIWANYPVAPSGNRNLISFQHDAAGSAIQLGFRGGNAVAWKWGGTVLANGGSSPSINSWHYYVYTYDGTTSSIYIDGILAGSSTVAPQTLTPTVGNIGRYDNGEYIRASLDEPRFSMSPKSSGWILTEYNNQNDPSGFISSGPETDASILAAVGACSTTFTLDQGYPSGGTYSGTGVSATNFNASLAGPGTHAITYIYTDAFGCTASISKNITVTPVPAAPSTTDTECCISNILDLEATGTNLKWYSDAGLTIPAGTGTPFATGQTTAGTYTYYVTQTVNGCESPASSASLVVLDGITISAQPQDTEICEGNDALISVTASGYNMSYQWQENGLNISDGGIYSGTSTSTLVLSNPGIASDGNTYRCIISSSCGSSPQASDEALLTVNPLPVASFTYSGNPYCPNAPNPLPSFTGGAIAGTFSSTAGLVFADPAGGEINMAASTPGTYTVTNTIEASGGCASVSATSPFVIITNRVWTGAVDSDWNLPANWSCELLPDITTPVIISNVPNAPVLSTGPAAITGNLVIDAGASLTVSGNTIQLAGTIINNGEFIATEGTVELNGTSAQSVEAGTFSGNTINSLVINNPAGVSLQGALFVSGSVLLQNGDLSAAGYLTLSSDASGTALLLNTGTGTVTGNLTMQRYLPSGFGYKYFSSPFRAATVSEFGDDMDLDFWFPTFYRYDESMTSSGWVDYSDPANVLEPVKGYAANLGSSTAANTVDITGEVNNGALSLSLYNNNNSYTRGMNLVGNPYPSPIDWDAAGGWTRTNIDDAVYFFKSGTTDQYGGTYSSYVNGIPSDGTVSAIIPSMQGFFVHVSDGAYPVTGVLGMNNNVRVNDHSQAFTKSAATVSAGKSSVPLLRLAVFFENNDQDTDPMVIYLHEYASEGFDKKYDALKLLNTDFNVPNLYAVIPGDRILSINALPDQHDEVLSIPLGLKTNRAGTVKFRLSESDDYFMHASIYLSDTETGARHDLKSDSEYTVSLEPGQYHNRFFLDITGLATGITPAPDQDDIFEVYFSNNMLKTNILTVTGSKGMFSVFNLTGQMIFSKKIAEPGYYEFDAPRFPGIYIINYLTGAQSVSKKIFIGN